MKKPEYEDSVLELIPYYNSSATVRQRVWELEQKAGSLPTLFAVLIGAYITAEARHIPIFIVPERYRILIAAIIVAIIFIYRDKRERAKQKAKEAKDKVKGKMDQKQQNITDY